MVKLKAQLKKLVFPITLMGVVALAGIILSIQALYVAFTNDHTAAIYAAVIIPLTLFAFTLYAVDRILINKVSYLKLNLFELLVLVILYFFFLQA